MGQSDILGLLELASGHSQGLVSPEACFFLLASTVAQEVKGRRSPCKGGVMQEHSAFLAVQGALPHRDLKPEFV